MSDSDEGNHFLAFAGERTLDLLGIASSIKRDFENTTDPIHKRRLARFVVRTLATTLEEMAGEEVMREACSKPGADQPRADHLAALAERLDLLAPAFEHLDSADDMHGLHLASDELRMIAEGSAPFLFAKAKPSGKFKNTPRLARHWLRATEWVEFLSLSADTKDEVWDRVKGAYGVSFEGLKSWREQSRKYLGDDVDRRLRLIRERKSPFFIFRTEADCWARLESDAQAYIKEARFNPPE